MLAPLWCNILPKVTLRLHHRVNIAIDDRLARPSRGLPGALVRSDGFILDIHGKISLRRGNALRGLSTAIFWIMDDERPAGSMSLPSKCQCG